MIDAPWFNQPNQGFYSEPEPIWLLNDDILISERLTPKSCGARNQETIDTLVRTDGLRPILKAIINLRNEPGHHVDWTLHIGQDASLRLKAGFPGKVHASAPAGAVDLVAVTSELERLVADSATDEPWSTALSIDRGYGTQPTNIEPGALTGLLTDLVARLTFASADLEAAWANNLPLTRSTSSGSPGFYPASRASRATSSLCSTSHLTSESIAELRPDILTYLRRCG